MKKFSLIIALCLMLTIGGVYATWIYSGNQVEPQTQQFVGQMGGMDHEGNAGSYTFINEGLEFAVEPNTQEAKETTIVWNDKSLVLNFTPKSDISDAAKEAALNATIIVEIISENAGIYNGQTVYSIAPDFKITLDESKWTPVDTDADDVVDHYSFVIDKSNIEGSILIEKIALPSEDDYVLFKEAIKNVKFRVRVTGATISAT